MNAEPTGGCSVPRMGAVTDGRGRAAHTLGADGLEEAVRGALVPADLPAERPRAHRGHGAAAGPGDRVHAGPAHRGRCADGGHEELCQVQETGRAGPGEVRRIARRLTPGCWTNVSCPVRSSPSPPASPGPSCPYATGSTRACRRSAGGPNSCLELCVRHDGRATGDAPEGAGIRGVRERAHIGAAGRAVLPASHGRRWRHHRCRHPSPGGDDTHPSSSSRRRRCHAWDDCA